MSTDETEYSPYHCTAYADQIACTPTLSTDNNVTINTLYAPTHRYPVCFSLLLYYDATLPMLD